MNTLKHYNLNPKSKIKVAFTKIEIFLYEKYDNIFLK